MPDDFEVLQFLTFQFCFNIISSTKSSLSSLSSRPHLTLHPPLPLTPLPLSLLSPSRIFLGMLGFGFTILFCTAFCRVCQRFRDDQLEREEWLRNREADRPTSVFVIPVQGGHSALGREDYPVRGPPRYSQEVHRPPRYSTTTGPPPAYNEVRRDVVGMATTVGSDMQTHCIMQDFNTNISFYYFVLLFLFFYVTYALSVKSVLYGLIYSIIFFQPLSKMSVFSVKADEMSSITFNL